MNRTFWEGRATLVTGATGLLGSWLVPALVGRGAHVVALVRDGSPRSALVQGGWLDKISTVHGSVIDSDLIRRVVAEYSVDTVFHLAAQTLVGVAKQDPAGTLDANVRGTWTLLEAARVTRPCQVLVASSDKAYGQSDRLPYREEDPLRGCFPYDVSKSCVDLIAAMYATTYSLPVGIVRCGNLFGGGDLNFSRVIPGAILATLRGESFVIRSNGQYVRDYLYVEDAADAYILLAERLAEDKSLYGQAFNFGLECRSTVLDIVNLILRLLGRTDLKPTVLGAALAEIPEQYLSAEKARRLLRWSPRLGLEEGLSRSVAWYREYLAKLEHAAVQAVCP